MNKYFVLLVLSATLFGCAPSVKIPDQTKEPKINYENEYQKIQEAVELHDKGKFEEAVIIYEEILAQNPDNVAALYEIAYSLSMMGNYQKSLEYALKGFEYKSNLIDQLYVIAGNDLDLLGRSKEAVSLYKKGIKKHPDVFMLHYNLAISYINLNKLKEAEESLINSIKLNKFHTSSHLALAKVYGFQGKQVPALLLLFRFLTLEPNTQRSGEAISLIDELLNMGIDQKDDKNININLFGSEENSPYSTIEMMLRLNKVTQLTDSGKSIVEFRIDDVSKLISMIHENKDEKFTDFTANYLFPYFSKLNDTKNIEPFVYFIHQSADNKEIRTWIQNNKEKVKEFLTWHEDYKW